MVADQPISPWASQTFAPQAPTALDRARCGVRYAMGFGLGGAALALVTAPRGQVQSQMLVTGAWLAIVGIGAYGVTMLGTAMKVVPDDPSC